MTDSKHTPGPWQAMPVAEHSTTGQTIIVLNYDGYPTAFVPGWTDNPETTSEAQANARLIAAAPDLLAALRLAEGRLALLLRIFPDEHDECDHPVATTGVHKSVLAAIAKATTPEN